jgi:hypothetical protein
MPVDSIIHSIDSETFAEFCAQRDARNTIELNVRKWTLMLCDALLKNYIDYSIKSHQRSVYLEVNVDYHQACIEELKNGQCGYKFYIESGRKYHKIIMDAQTPPSAGAPITWPGSRSVHAFVDKKTGEVYKPASFKAPAKHVRYDLRLIKDREWLFENADWAGEYLYLIFNKG